MCTTRVGHAYSLIGARLLSWATRETVGGAGGGKFVVAVLEVLALVEELLFEFGNTLTESADFVGSGEASLVEDLFAEDFRQPLAELGVVVSESFVVCAQVGEVGQQRPVAGAGARRGWVRVRRRG